MNSLFVSEKDLLKDIIFMILINAFPVLQEVGGDENNIPVLCYYYFQ